MRLTGSGIVRDDTVMTDRVTAPYGAWPSPISAADVARATLRLGFPTVVDGGIWWQETHPDEGGRTTVVHGTGDGSRHDLLAAHWSARTRVHEYGGRSYHVVPAGDGHTIVFAHYDDQRLYRLDAENGAGTDEPRPLTPQPEVDSGLRYADFVTSPDGAHIWCVRESHDRSETAVSRAVVAVPLDGSAAENPSAVRELVTGADFFACPRPAPDGAHLVWISWNHPRMPWDGTELRIAAVNDDGSLGKSRALKGTPTESVLAPQWRDSEHLYVVSDWSGWWNLYELDIYGASPPQALYPSEEEFSGPLWQLGGSPYALLDDGRIACVHGQGESRLGVIDPETAELTDLDLTYTDWSFALSASGQTVAGIAGSPTQPRSVVRVDVATGEAEPLRRETDELPEAAYLPAPRAELLEGPLGQEVHAYVHPPANPDAQAPEGELPPYVVFVHGGPTQHVTGVLDLEKAYFTSRGIGVLDVNYGGSSGYGRAYRERLRHQWGVVDVEDAVAAAQTLVERGDADGNRLAIRGHSAGGWTTLAALIQSTPFQAGTSYYGIAELSSFAGETHDFESCYLEGLVGPLPRDEHVYSDRSPLTHVDRVTAPVLLLQGLDDPIVLPSQAEQFTQALTERGVPHAYLSFEGEGHGFRSAQIRTHALSAELSFYGQVLGFTPPDVPALELNRPTVTTAGT